MGCNVRDGKNTESGQGLDAAFPRIMRENFTRAGFCRGKKGKNMGFLQNSRMASGMLKNSQIRLTARGNKK
jgi:hypothetical protein